MHSLEVSPRIQLDNVSFQMGTYVSKHKEGGYGLNPELLNPLQRSIGTLQDVLDRLKASLPQSRGRRPFQVDSDYYWIQQIAHKLKNWGRFLMPQL